VILPQLSLKTNLASHFTQPPHHLRLATSSTTCCIIYDLLHHLRVTASSTTRCIIHWQRKMPPQDLLSSPPRARTKASANNPPVTRAKPVKRQSRTMPKALPEPQRPKEINPVQYEHLRQNAVFNVGPPKDWTLKRQAIRLEAAQNGIHLPVRTTLDPVTPGNEQPLPGKPKRKNTAGRNQARRTPLTPHTPIGQTTPTSNPWPIDPQLQHTALPNEALQTASGPHTRNDLPLTTDKPWLIDPLLRDTAQLIQPLQTASVPYAPKSTAGVNHILQTASGPYTLGLQIGQERFCSYSNLSAIPTSNVFRVPDLKRPTDDASHLIDNFMNPPPAKRVRFDDSPKASISSLHLNALPSSLGKGLDASARNKGLQPQSSTTGVFVQQHSLSGALREESLCSPSALPSFNPPCSPFASSTNGPSNQIPMAGISQGMQAPQFSSHPEEDLPYRPARPSIIIGISGCSSSGKTTLSSLLAVAFSNASSDALSALRSGTNDNANREEGVEIAKIRVVHQDEFFLPKERCPKITWPEIILNCSEQERKSILRGNPEWDTTPAKNQLLRKDFWEYAYQENIGIDPRMLYQGPFYPPIPRPDPLTTQKDGFNTDCRQAIDWLRFLPCIDEIAKGIDCDLEVTDATALTVERMRRGESLNMIRPEIMDQEMERIRRWVTEQSKLNSDLGFSGCFVHDGTLKRTALVEGFLLYLQDEDNPIPVMKTLRESLDIKLFLPTSRKTARARRFARPEYRNAQPHQFWKSACYFDKIAW
jgi:hypothetical protein